MDGQREYLRALWSVWSAMSRVLGCQALHLSCPTPLTRARRDAALARYQQACARAAAAQGAQ